MAGRGGRSTADWIGSVGAVLRNVPPGIWVSAALGVIGATLLRLSTAGMPMAAAVAGIVQLLILLLLNFALYRAAAGVRPVLVPGAAMMRFAAMLAGTILFSLIPLGAARALVPAGARLADIWLWSFAATMLAGLLLLPLQPWIAALALGDRSLGPAGGAGILRRRLLSYAGAYLAVVGPCLAIHLMLTMLLDDPGSTLAGPALIAVVVFDSAASLAQLVLTVGLGVAALRLRETDRAR